MEFSVTVATNIGDWQLIKFAEDLGYDRAWVPDSQMIWSDCYATMAVAAQNTSRIKLGTGVAIPGTRIAPVTAHSIASVNRIAPGRVFLGIGTGHTAMRVMGMNPMKIRDFREYLRVLRTLLQGEEVEYTLNDTTRTIQFLHQDLKFIELEQPVPIIVAANGPLGPQSRRGIWGWSDLGAERAGGRPQSEYGLCGSGGRQSWPGPERLSYRLAHLGRCAGAG